MDEVRDPAYEYAGDYAQLAGGPMRAEPKAECVMEWRPINTAPEGAWILTYGDWQEPPVGVSRFRTFARIVQEVEHEVVNAKGRRRIIQETEVQEREWEGSHHEPTHWMPIPAPPKE